MMSKMAEDAIYHYARQEWMELKAAGLAQENQFGNACILYGLEAKKKFNIAWEHAEKLAAENTALAARIKAHGEWK